MNTSEVILVAISTIALTNIIETCKKDKCQQTFSPPCNPCLQITNCCFQKCPDTFCDNCKPPCPKKPQDNCYYTIYKRNC